MELVSRDDLKNIETYGRSKVDWPELESMVKKLGSKDMGRVSEDEIRKYFAGKHWKTAIRAKIKSLGGSHGKRLQVVFDKTDGDCYFYITNV